MIDIKARVSGEYRFVLNEGKANEKDTGWFKNMVTDQGLNRLGSTNTPAVLPNCSVGTGTNTPAASDTALQTYVAQKIGLSAGATQTFAGSPTYASSVTLQYTFAQGIAANLAEVGIGWGTLGSSLFSRARILDGVGAPTTLTVTALDELTVYYRLTVTPNLADSSGTISINGVSTNWVSRHSTVNANFFQPNIYFMFDNANRWGSDMDIVQAFPSTSTLGTTTSAPSGTPVSVTDTVAPAAYTPGNFYCDCTNTINAATGNASGGIAAVLLNWGNSGGRTQVSFSPPIAKDNTKTLALTFRYSWSR